VGVFIPYFFAGRRCPATHGGRISPFKEMSFDEGSRTTQEARPMFGCLEGSSAPAVYKCISIDTRK
jgi:hypothetical protein